MAQITGKLQLVQQANALTNMETPGAVSTTNPGGGLEDIRSVGSVETRYGLVTILVDEDTWDSQATGSSGLFSFLGSTNIDEKIETYAEDIQSTLPWTKAMIVTVSEDDGPVEIMHLLEELYFQGNPDDDDATKLAGVVAIGDVPLPVVNKNGHRFISMLPYTDFEAPAYLLDESTQDFVPNLDSQNFQAEVWHGLIVPPVDGDAGIDLLAEFFDKNHAFHSGDEDATNFDQKTLVTDFVTEESTINGVSFDSYNRFTDIWEEMTYYQYTNDLFEDMYTDMMNSAEAGDFLDNDGDGEYDEEASNGKDDDGDGLIDEDLGDGFYLIDNDEDGDIDEDSYEDNNNDADWVIEDFWEDDLPDFYQDRMVDEDPPGDANGDGCPGVCGVDDNGFSEDHDGDGYPTAWEVLYGYAWDNDKRPFKRVSKMVESKYGVELEDEAATEFLQEMFIDDMYGDYYQSPTCMDSSGNFHPEWDDDEDGFCDEDGSTEMQVWLNASAYPASGTCAYNDADCDGLIDEDPVGMRPDEVFELIPDMQSKLLVEGLISRYTDIFAKPQGVWNRIVNQSGRYKSRYVNEDGDTVNDYDTAVSLIAKKDEQVLLYLGQVNGYFEEALDEVAEDLQQEIPMVAVAQITGYYIPYESDGSEGDPVEICNEGASPDVATDACIQFVNHSTVSEGRDFEAYNMDYEANNILIYGETLWEIEEPSHCTIFAGTEEEGGQKVQFNTLYSVSNVEIDNSRQIDKMNNCVPDYASFREDIPQLCNEPTVEYPIRALDGTREAVEIAEEAELEDTSGWETGFEACFEFREMHTFEIYKDSYEDFNDWMSRQIRRFRKDEGDEGDDDVENYEEFLVNVEAKKAEATPETGTATLRKNYSELDILASDTGATYSVVNMLEDFMGWTGEAEASNDQIDTFLGVWRDADEIVIADPDFGTGMSGIAELQITLDKLYIDESTVGDTSPSFTTQLSNAYTIPSMYKHVEPTGETLTAQVQNPGAMNLPIDKTRRVSFLDEDDTAQYWNYINAFDAETMTDINVQLKNLAEDVAAASGGNSYRSDVINFIDRVNEDQLEDALAWHYMNIDEKHHYILTHYLGAGVAINSESLAGYEMVSMIADGTANEMFFGFNGAMPDDEDEGDLLWRYRSQYAIDEALAAAASTAEPTYEPLSDLEGTTAVLLSEWMEAVQEWIEDLKQATNGFDAYDGGAECGDISQFTGSADDNGDGMPDGADDTVTLKLTSDDNDILQAGGKDYYVVTAAAYGARGFINTDDSYTEVELEIVSGDGVVEVSGNSTLKLTGGTSTFVLVSADIGSFTVQATPVNRDDLYDSNTLSGSVTSKFVAVTTFVKEAAGTDAEIIAGDKIEVFDDDGNLLAILDPDTGDLDLRIVGGERASAQVLAATGDKPTRFAVSHGGGIYAVFFVISSVKEVWIGDGVDGAYVSKVASFVDAEKEGSGSSSIVYLYDFEEGDGAASDDASEDDGLMGAVSALGQIAVADGYYLEFENPGELNIFDPIHIYNGDGEDLFAVKIGHVFSNASLDEPVDEHADYLSQLADKLLAAAAFVKEAVVSVARAASDALDSDDDSLSDLEEWTIGTNLTNPDTDADSYPDGEEIFAGYSPLSSSAPLFTDLDPDHEAFNAVVELYLRGIVSGYADGSFLPDRNMSREEFVKVNLGSICVACTNLSEDVLAELMAEYLNDPFPDANINPELLPCVAYAKDAGIVSGYAGGEMDGYFLPGRYISRAEAVKVLVETAGLPVSAADADELWYTEYVNTALDYSLFADEDKVTSSWLEGDITRGEFAMMAVALLSVQDCRSVDNDDDGLSDIEEELVYGTDPNNADTDGGGVSDFDEVIRGSDPLDADDDIGTTGDDDAADGDEVANGLDFSYLLGFDHAAGLYAVAEDENAGFEEISVLSGEGDAIINVFTGEIAADGESVLFVKAEIRDQAGNVYVEDDTSVIEFILSTAEYGDVQSSRVQVSNGQAETTFVTTQVAGEVSIEARITDGSLPSQEADVQVYPGDPVRLSVSSESSVLPVGGEAVTDVRVTLYDSFGNAANNGFYGLTIAVEGGIQILDLNDEDSDTEGIQVTTPDGYIDFRVLASSVPETAKVLASLTTDAEDAAAGYSATIYSASIEHIDGMRIALTPERDYMFAGGTRTQSVAIAVTDRIGRVVTGFQGDIYMSMSDPGYGSFSDDNGMGQLELSLSAGAGLAELAPGTLGGLGSMIAESTGIEAGSASIEIKPSESYELKIREENDASVLSAGKNVRFYVEAYDLYGNLVSTDSSTRGEIWITEATEDYGTLSSDVFTLNQGSASFTLRTADISGVLNLVATSGDLLAGTWSGQIDFSLTGEDFEDVEPMMLYGSLLGGPFGDVTQEDYIAGWMTFNGKTQAMTSLISEPTPNKRMVSIDADGAVSIPDESLVTQTVRGAGTNLPMRLQWRTFPDDTLIGEVFYVAPSTGTATDDADAAISIELLTTRYDLEIDGGVLREDGAAAVKVRDDGQIVLMDPNYSLAVNADTDGLGFIVMRTTEQVMRIDFNVDFGGVTLLESNFDLEDWDSKASGIYLRPTTASENATVSVPTGNSSLSPMGLAIVDPDEELPKSMQPSLGYMSLESAESDGNIGWENENKHLLLFAAGNTVGQSNLFYPSEVGVVLGDPTVSVQTQTETNSLGYTKDIGTMVSASQDEILTLMDIDYNDDGMEDVLIAYEDGLVEVLQNFKAPVRLQNEGDLLYVENGISAIDRGDFNGDGMDDIFVVTKESCYADEMCMYVYENIGGGFVAQNLTLSGISGQPTQVVVADLNNDDYSDLVIADENLVLYVVWNAEGTLETVDEIKDFGLQADGSVNLSGEALLRYDGLEDDFVGSVNLSVPSTDLDVDSMSADLEAMLAAISGNPDYDFNLNGEASGELERLVDAKFEFADIVAAGGGLTVTKTLDDENGGRIEVGDTLSYTIEIDNISGGTYSDFYLSDSVAGTFEYLGDSITAEFVAADGTEESLDDDALAEFITAGESSSPWILGPVSMTAGEELTVTYEVTVNSLPSLTIMVDQDFHDDYKDDNYTDIAISMDGNATGILMVYYSDGYITESEGGVLGGRFGGTSYRRVNYIEKKYVPDDYAEEASTEPDSPFEDADGDGTPDFIQDMDEDLGMPVPSAGSYDPFAAIFGANDVDGDGYYSTEEMFKSDDDIDGDGILDIIDLFVGDVDMMLDPSLDLDASDDGESVRLSSTGDITLEGELNLLNEETEQVAQVIEDIVSAFTCNGGCIAFPGSISFLTPGVWHDPFTGTTFGADQGFPIFGITPNPPFVCSGPACFASSVMRIYLSPTTTLGLGLGICISAYGTPLNCMAFSIPLLQMLGVCDAINNFITDSLSSVSSFVSDGTSQVFNVDSSSASNGDPNGLSSAIFDAYVPPVSANMNIQIPGFPAIFTEWWKAQKLELFKMLDLPDITVIYPKVELLTTGDSFEYEKESKLEAITGSVLGLESLLNTLNSLPLINIDPEPIYIHYPFLTPEEIDLAVYDFEQWQIDFQNEWDDFKEQFQVTHGDDLSPSEWEAYGELKDAVEEIMSGIAANRAVLESYREIPREILEIRMLVAEYVKTIICYLDAILSHTAGYLSENVQRAETWAQWAVDLRDIVDGWRIIIDSSVNMMDSCDKCTNQRWSAMQLIFSLFVFLPEFPVVEMPKLPDIVLDVSNIQAGIDITWPDLNFVAETVTIPDLPRVDFPSVYLDLDFDLDINIPVLPEFPLAFNLPDLPGLTLPDLPSIPPPPAVPQIDPSIQVAVKILTTVLKVVCIIRNGFVPVNETSLKTKIEDLTERGSGFVLPFDLEITADWPSFSFDFVERIEIRTYTNFVIDFSGFYDLFTDLEEQSNAMVGDITSEISEAFQDVVDQIESATLAPGEIELDLDLDVEVDIDLESYVPATDELHPALAAALEYKDHPLVSSNLIALQQALGTLQEDFAAWDEEMPDSYELVAEETLLAVDDPLLHRYDEIINGDMRLDASFIAQIQGSPLASVATLRDSLITYVDDFESTSRKLDGMDENMFSTYLAQESEQNAASQFMLASEEEEAGFSSGDAWNLEETMEIFDGSGLGDANSAEDAEVMLAEEDGTGTTGTGGEWDTSSAATYNDGIYIYNPDEGVADRLINYTQESDEASSILFIDIDDDGDDDIIYSMGGDVYIKENYSDSPSLRYNGSDPQISSLEEIGPENGAVYNFKRGTNGYEEASFAFSAAQEAAGYEVIFYDSLDASIAEPDENLKRLLLLADEENDSAVFYNSEGTEHPRGSLMVASDNSAVFQGGDELSILVPSGGEFNVPSIVSSRLVASDVSGNVVIQNGAKRTLISENGELETAADVILQTTEETLLKVEIDGKTTNIELPAYTLIDLGSEQDRTVRVDSGEVFWIQPEETVAEQDLETGMEIFAEEIVMLDSTLASASLQTSEGAMIELDKQEIFIMDGLPNEASPNSHISLENGLFYTVVRGIFDDGSVGTISERVTLNPQVCADRNAPYAILDSSMDLAIFATQEMSAESSFDTDSEIVDAYWDLDASVDVNGDGIGNNDEEVIGLTAEIGPYEDVDPKEVTFWITDAAGNQDTATMTVNIYVPDLQIASATSGSSATDDDAEDASGAEVSGTTEPASPYFPFYLVREREGAFNELGGVNYTDEYGDFLVDDLDSSDLLSVYDSNGNIVAQFNPATLQLLVFSDAYEAMVLPAESQWPTRLVVFEKSNGLIIGSFLIVADENRLITEMSKPLENYDLGIQSGVTVHILDAAADSGGYDVNDFEVLGRDSLGNLEMTLSSTGNVVIYDSGMEIVKRAADSLDEHLIIEVYDDGVLEMEIWPGNPGNVQLVYTGDLSLPASGTVWHDSLSADTRLYFEDIATTDDLYENIAELVERGILEGYDVSGKHYFLPNNDINRAEFAKIILGILCIIPSDEAYSEPGVFSDISDPDEWFYPYTKEASLHELITGYLGEVDADGMAPFKPDNTITRAEAAKIILEALDKEGIIELPAADELAGEPWYEPYLAIAQDLTPYMDSSASAGEANYILSSSEARDPAHVVTRYEFVQMSVRVLQAYNCFDLDSDGDGLINYDEESLYSTDPYDPDTDAGGVDDGTEVDRGTDPLYSADDFEDDDFDIDSGIYAVRETCYSCPCESNIDFAADLKYGDKVFGIIKNAVGEIFGISNTLTVSE